MAKYSNVVEYNIVTDVDTSGIIKLQNELTKLKQSLKFDKSGFSQLGFDDAKIEKSIQKVNQLQTAIAAAFNPKIGTIDLSKLNASLQKEHTSLQMIVKDWEQMGTRGTMAISNLSNALLSMNKGALNVNTTLSKIANTFGNTVRWGITASIFQEMMSSVQGAVSYMKDLDESLTQIQMVTNSSKEDMRELAQYANSAAQALGSTTTDYTNAVKVFVQEGFSERESKQYADLSIKLANVSEQDTATTSDQITAFRNAFQLDFEQTAAAMDKVANVANNTASNVNELMTASQRAASVAQAVGASQDSFLASIATIESVTRQSAEEIGNGLKTIYQRFADIKAGGSAEDGVDYGQYANALKSIGVDVLDATGQFKGMDQILQETQEVWSSLSDTMKIAVGEKVAGKFQYNRFAALMNNPEYYQKALNATGAGSEGMMNQMNDIYMESIEGRLNTLQAAGEQVMSTLFNQDAVEPVIEDVTHLVNGLNDLVEAMGGLNGVLPAISALMLRTFSTQIAGTVTNMATSIGTIVANSRNANQLQTTASLVGLSNYDQTYGQAQGQKSVAGKLVASVADNYDQLSVKTQEKIRDLSQQIVELEEQKTGILKEQELFFKQIGAKAVEEKFAIQQQVTEYAEEIKLIEEKAKAGKASTEEIEKSLQLEEKVKNELSKKLKIYTEISKEVANYANKIATGAGVDEKMITRLQEMRREASGLGINIAELESLIEKLGVASNNLKIGEKMVEATVSTVNLEANINNIIRGLSSLTSIAFGVSMIGETFKTLGDESASLKEKIDAIALNGLMGITMLVPGIMQGVNAVRELNKAWEAWKVQQAAAIVVEELWADKQALNISLRSDTVKKIAVESIEQGKLNKEKMTAALIEAGYSETMAKGIATKTANLAIEEATGKVTTSQIIKTGLRTAATEALTAALRRLGIEQSRVAAMAGPIGWAILGIGAALTAATIAVNQYAEAEEKRKQQLEEQINTSNQIVQKLNETKSAYDEVYDNYKRTGAASEDLKNKSLELAEALKIEGAEALANAGRYDELNEKIQQASLNQREYNTALLRQQSRDLNAENSTLSSPVVGDNGYIIGEGSSISGDQRIETKKSAIETAEKEIAVAREQLALLDNTKDGYIEEKAALEELIKTKQAYVTQNTLTENEEKQVEVYKGIAENTANIFKDSGLFNNVKNYQEVIDELQSNEDIKKYLSFLGEEEARAWIQAYTQEILAGKTDILEAYQKAIADENAAFDAYNSDISLQEQLKSLNINSVEDFSKAIENGTINIEGFAESVKLLTSAAEDLTTNINGNTFTNRIDISSNEEDFKDFLNDSGMSEGAFNRMSRNSYEEEGGYYQKEKERLEDLIAVKKEDGKVTEEEAEEISKINLEIEDLDDAARDTTAAILRMSNGVVTLRNKIGDISEILTNDALKGTTEWYEALDDLDKGLSEVLNIDAGTLSDTFIESGDALAYAQRMAEGDMSAIDDLRIAAAQDIIQNLSIQLKKGEDVDAVRSQLLNELNQLQAEINAGTITITTDLDDKPFIQKLNMMLADSQISAEQASNILSSIGMDAKIQYAEGKGTVDAVEYEVAVDWVDQVGPMPDGSQAPSIPKIRMIPHMVPVETTTRIPYLQGTHYTGSGVQTANTAARNPSYTGGYSSNPKPSGGKSSSPKNNSTPKQKTIDPEDKQKNEWDYLTDITNDLDRASAAMEKLTKLEDRLFGKSRISNLKKMQSEYKGYIKLLEKEVSLAKKHVKNQQTHTYDENGNLTLNGFAGRAGFGSVKFDSKGNIENGKNIEAALTQKVNDEIERYNAAVRNGVEDTTWYKKNIELAQKDHDDFMKAVSDYESSLKTIEDSQSQIQEYNEKIQDAADEIVDSIQEGIDQVVEAMDSQREFNRMARNWREGGSGYSHFDNDRRFYSEGLSNLLSSTLNKNSISVIDAEIKNLDKRIKDAEDVFDKSGKDGKTADEEKLSQQAARENLREATDKVVDSLNDIIGYYDSLLDTISEASAKMDELVDNRLEAYDRIEDILDTRLNQVKLLFGDDYGAQIKLYNQKINTNMSKMATIGEALEAKQITVRELEKLESSDKKLSTEQRKELRDARNEVAKLQQEQIDTETSLLQDIASKLEAQVRSQVDEMVNGFFGGQDAEWIAQQWEIATRNSEQYLDDYNRAFEIQKLQLKYQNLLNDTQNAGLAVQQRISAHMKDQLDYLRTRTDASKENLAISKYDVQYAEKQLEILQKQIALEEAQNNKSQMRLQRNAAGNYDFVYGADENAVNQAQQALLNAQQEAYNLSKQIFLETYDNAVQTALKTKEIVVQIATDASLSFDEKAKRINYTLESLKEYMNNSSVEIKGISVNLYNDFIEADNLIAQENLGKLEEVYEGIRTLSSNTLGTMKQDLIDYQTGEGGTDESWENFAKSALGVFTKILSGAEGLFGDKGTMKELLQTTEEDSDTSWTNIGNSLEKDKLPRISNSIKSAFMQQSEGDDSIEGIISAALTSIDDRFKVTETESITTANNIDQGIRETFDKITGSDGYLREYESINNEVLINTGTTYDNFVSDSLTPTAEGTKELDDDAVSLKEDLGYLNNVISASTTAIGGENGWNSKISDAITKAEKFVPKANAMDEALGDIEYSASLAADELERIAENSDIDVSVDYTTTYTTYHNDVYTTSYSDGGGGSSYDNSYSEPTYTNSTPIYSSNDDSSSNDNRPTHYSVHGFGGGMVFRTTSYTAAEEYKKNHSRPGMPLTIKVGQWDTGGYTGTWTDMGMDEKKGKLAILHQKELVLNADDTKNMLSTVEVVRDIMSNVNKLPSFGNSISSNASNNNVEQRVEVSANFPGVTTALEIERALTELADNAYQYANKYKY